MISFFPRRAIAAFRGSPYMSRSGKLFAALALLTVAAACEAPAPSSVEMMEPTTRAVAALPSNPLAGPGTQIVPPATAGRYFAEACLLTKPGFAGAGAALTDDPFTQNSSTKTYYHNTGNLSIKAVPGSCSLVMAINQSPEAALAAFSAAVNATAPDDDSDVSVRPAGVLNGQVMLVFRLTE
jgi:hypothetical protein